MSGQPTPPRIVEAFALNAPTCTQASPVAGGKTLPLPTGSQVGTLNGAASLHDGFPPLTMTAPTSGGTPPFGIDMNGVLYLISSWVAALAAGQLPQFDATLAADMGGYKVGAVLQQANNLNACWICTIDANVNNPDTGSTNGWLSTVPLYSAAALVGLNDVVLPGPSDYVIPVDTTAGALTYTGFVAQRDGQRITYACTGSGGNNLSFAALSGASAAAHRIQLSGATSISQGDSFSIKYSQGFGKWLAD